MKKALSLFLLASLLCALLTACGGGDGTFIGEDGNRYVFYEDAQTYELVDVQMSCSGELRLGTYDNLPITTLRSLSCSTDFVNSAVLSGNVTRVNERAFSGCTNMKDFRGGEHVTSFGHNAFENCYDLEAFTFPINTQFVGSRCFENCRNLSSVTFPDTIRNIGTNIFDGCSKMQFTVYDNAIYAEANGNPHYLLYRTIDTDITAVKIHDDTRIIAEFAFADCSKLAAVDLGSGVRTISASAFSNFSQHF